MLCAERSVNKIENFVFFTLTELHSQQPSIWEASPPTIFLHILSYQKF